MDNFEVPDVYISDLRLSKRFPELFCKPNSPMKGQIKKPIIKPSSNSGIKAHEHRVSKLRTSIFNIKKMGLSATGKSLKSETPVMQEVKLDQNFKVMKRGALPIQKCFNILRRKKNYKTIDRLTSDHYFVIGDLASNTLYEGAPILKKNKFKALKKLLGLNFLSRVSLVLRKADEKIPTFGINTHLGIAWNLIVLVLCVAQIFIYSVEKCFGTFLEANNLGYTVALIIWIDLFVKLNTRFYIDGVQILDRRKIFKHVARTNFLTDVIPCFCLTPLILISTNYQNFYDANLLLLLKISSASEIGEKLGNLLIKGDRSQSIYDLGVLILTILIWAHLTACFWHYIGYTSNLNNPDGLNWLKLKGITNESWSVRYLFSVYWGVTTMLTVGYGDISPSNETEVFFNIWAMVLGCGMFGYSMNRIGEILSVAGEDKRRQRKRMKKVVKMMKEKEVPPETEIKVRKYLEFVWKQEKREDPQHEKEIIEKLTSKLREEYLLSTNVKFLKRVEAFKTFSDKALLYLANFMRKVRFSPEELVYKDKDNEDLSVFFVIDGALESVIWAEKNSPAINTIKTVYRKYDYFGVQEIFSGRPRVSGVASIDFSTVFKLSRNDILYVLQRCPEDYERFCKLRDMDIIYDNQCFYNIKCESCGFDDHRINECRYLRFVPIRLNLIGRYRNRKAKIRKNFKRKPHQKKNCLIEMSLYRDLIEQFIQNYYDDPQMIQLIEYNEKLNSEQEFDDDKWQSSANNIGEPILEKYEEKSEDLDALSLERFATQKSSKTISISSQKFKTKSSNTLYSHVSGFRGQGQDNNRTLSIIDKRHRSHELKTLNSSHTHTTKSNFRELPFEKVKSYKFYFPWNNVENVVRKINNFTKRNNSSPKNLAAFS